MSKSVGVIICAAGAGTRFGGKRNKPFVDVAGRAAFLRSVELFTGRDDVKQVLLAISPQDQELVDVKWGPNLKFYNVQICFGGAERFDTVTKALELVKETIDLIAVHDAVRCCVTKKWIDDCFAVAAKTGAAMLACPVSATIKKVKDNVIQQTVDRSGLYEAQTPQIFEASLLKKAYGNLKNLDKNKISDDSQLVETLGQKVSIVETDSSNIKITRKSDVPIAEAILKTREKLKPKGYLGPYAEAEW
ncbi:MAG: 2-C-methyl-D-erythritol 4-phosphate cytidylyltransferase [Planctomycetes bacterium]|nr:2-C-methyl-D-erythritol 4-phosphate cytidylyltransferase [Planctomycetota bacterium]